MTHQGWTISSKKGGEAMSELVTVAVIIAFAYLIRCLTSFVKSIKG